MVMDRCAPGLMLLIHSSLADPYMAHKAAPSGARTTLAAAVPEDRSLCTWMRCSRTTPGRVRFAGLTGMHRNAQFHLRAFHLAYGDRKWDHRYHAHRIARVCVSTVLDLSTDVGTRVEASIITVGYRDPDDRPVVLDSLRGTTGLMQWCSEWPTASATACRTL